MKAIELKDVVKVYPNTALFSSFHRERKNTEDVIALDRVSLTVDKGEILGLVGPNGAGKTTLINILCTLIIPTSGSAWVGDKDVLTEASDVRRFVGLVTSNERSFYWRLTGRQNLHFFSNLYHISHRESESWIEELLDVLDLRPYADRRFDSYSTGIRQRFAFARGLLHRPSVIFMDEPTKGLDPLASTELIHLIRERIMALWSPTVIMTSHNMKEIEQLCTKVAIMGRSRILHCGTIYELSQSVSTDKSYRLIVSKLQPGCLEVIEGMRDIVGVQSSRHEGSTHLEITLSGRNGVISDVLRTLLSGGGEVTHCSEVSASLQEIFSRIISSSTGGKL